MDIKLIRHYVAGLILIGCLAALVSGSYTSIKSYYGFNETYTGAEGTDNIADRIDKMGIVQSIHDLMNGVFKIANPTGAVDLVGGIMLAGFGALGFVSGLITLPISVLGILTNFYYIPPIVNIAIASLILCYIAFIILSSKLRGEV